MLILHEKELRLEVNQDGRVRGREAHLPTQPQQTYCTWGTILTETQLETG